MQEKDRNFTTEELVMRYQRTTNEDILAEILRRNRGLLYKWGQEYSLVGYDMEDKLSEAYIATLRAIDTYNNAEGVMFSSYLKTCVKQAYDRIYNSQHRQKRYTGYTPDSWEALEEIHKEKAVEVDLLSDMAVMEFLNSLEEKLQYIAVNLLEGTSKSDVARALGITPASTTYHIKRLQGLAKDYFGLGGSKRLIRAV